MSKPLQVKPVRGYRVARYPSHADPDPSEYPDSVPFPFRREFVSAVALLGISSCAEPSAAPVPTAPPATTARAAPGAAVNPFAFANSGLPHQTSPYGTGVPQYLQDEIARKAVEAVFSQEGIELTPTVQLQGDNLAFVADGYDSKRRIGYVFANYQNLEDDALIRWWLQGVNIDTMPDERLAPYAGQMEWRRLSDEQKARLKAASAEKAPDKLRAVIKQIEEELAEADLSLAEIKALAAPTEEAKFILVISQFDRRFITEYGSPSSIAEKKCEGIEDPVKRREALAAAWKEAYLEVGQQLAEKLEVEVRAWIEWARSQGFQ